MCGGENHSCPNWYAHGQQTAAKKLSNARVAEKRKAERALAKEEKNQAAAASATKAARWGNSRLGQGGSDKCGIGQVEALGRIAVLEAALAAQTAANNQLVADAEAKALAENLQTAAAESRSRRAYGAPCTDATQQLYAAFEIGEDGLPRSKAASERAAQRAVAAFVGPLASLPCEQAAAVLQVGLKRPGVREAAAAAKIGGTSLGAAVLQRVKAALTSMGIKKGSMPADVEACIDTFLNLAAPAPNEEVLQRGVHAKRQKADGGEVQLAAVTGAREWAEALGISISTAWRRLKAAMERRAKLEKGEEDAYWTYYRERVGHGIDDATRKLVLDFYIAHPSIKRSPLTGDTLKLWSEEEGQRVIVAKLLSEVSLTDVYLDFEKAHPGKLKESAFRALRPPELRRMSKRHLDMCGCRWCIEMRLFQDALNKGRSEVALVSMPAKCEVSGLPLGPLYVPAYTHPKPSFAACDAASCVAKDSKGNILGHPPLRSVPMTILNIYIYIYHLYPPLLCHLLLQVHPRYLRQVRREPDEKSTA